MIIILGLLNPNPQELRHHDKVYFEHSGMLFAKTFEHLYISIVALVIAMIVAVPLGILLSKKEKLSKVSLTIAGVLQTIPTLAVLALMIPLFGVGKHLQL